jgi:predicted nuclease of restriction endonuclease-like RecB superfamily
MMKGKNKYGVSKPADRAFRGKTYDSKAERDYAEAVWMQLGTEYAEIVEQPRLFLGVRENVYVPDFLLIPLEGGEPHYVDVKGAETPKFAKDKRLYAEYGRLPLVIVARRGGRFYVKERIVPNREQPEHSDLFTGRQ